MPIAMAILGLAQSIYQERHGVSNSGLASFGNALSAFNSFYNNLSNVGAGNPNFMVDAGVRRNYL